MRNRILAVACGIILAVVGTPALPASAASGVTCTNLTMDSPTPEPLVLARACISWDDLPDGTRWTHHQSRIWNPPGAPSYKIEISVFRNTGYYAGGGELATDETLVVWTESVGVSTAKFEVRAENVSSVPWCIYLIPRGSNIEHHACY